MTLDLLAALVAFAFVSSATPGPNNLMLMASGTNFGVIRSLPHLLGVACGFTVMIFLVGAGLAQIFEQVPGTRAVLQAACVAYMLWLAWRIAQAGGPRTGTRASARPFTFWQAAAFQWVNPKAWAMALTALGAYAPGDDLAAVLAVALVFGAVNLPTVTGWVVLGRGIRRWLDDPQRLRRFNRVMALLLLGSVLPLLM